MTPRVLVGLGVGVLVGLVARPTYPQTLPLTGYLQSVPIGSGESELAPSNLSHFNRFRVATDPVFSSVRVEAAYEHVLTLRRRDVLFGLGVGVVPAGGEWLDLQWTIAEEEHVLWQHRFDRLSVGWSPTDRIEVSAGRQAISWGTTLFLTPSDPFTPFNPADPFREFRAGVDAARVRVFPSSLSEIDVVVRPTESVLGRELTTLARALFTWQNWELSGWGGSLYGDPTGAFGAAGALGSWAVRAEGVIRELDQRRGSESVFRGTVGVDRQLQVRGRDLYLIVEYQRDNLGVADPEDYLALLVSDTFLRGEHQVLGRDETVIQASYQLHPLWTVSGLWLWNLNDRSTLISPSVAYSAGNEVALSGGMFFGIGDAAATVARPLASEYGAVGTTGYVSLSWFF